MKPSGIIITILAGLVITAFAIDATVPGWRTDGTGLYPTATPPTVWSADKHVRWKKKLPAWANACPILIDNRLYVTAEIATLICLDADSGETLWQADCPRLPLLSPEAKAEADIAESALETLQAEADALRASETPEREKKGTLKNLDRKMKSLRNKLRPSTHNLNGYATATPVTDGKKIYTYFGNGVAAAFTLDGKTRWMQLLADPTHGWGHSTSPILCGGNVILHIADTVYALNPEDGSTVWKASNNTKWGTPMPFEVDGRAVLLTTGGMLLDGKTGRTLAENVGSMPWTSPLFHKGKIYIADQGEATAYAFATADDGSIEARQCWTTPVPKDRYYASPVVKDDLLYAITRKCQLVVLNADTGELVHEEKLNLGGTAYPSICSAGPYIFISSDSGKTLVAEPGIPLKKIGTNSLENVRSTPIFASNRIYIRGLEHLYCIEPRTDM